MGRQSDLRKVAAWERRIARFGDSGLTVAQGDCAMMGNVA